MRLSEIVKALGGDVQGMKYDPIIGYWDIETDTPAFPGLDHCTLEVGLDGDDASLIIGLAPRRRMP